MAIKKRTLRAIDLNGNPLDQFSGNEFEIWEDIDGKVHITLDKEKDINSEAIEKWDVDVDANPEMTGDEPELQGLQIGEQKYKISKPLSFTNVTADNWVASATYADYAYECAITCSGVTSSSVVEVIFGMDEAVSGNYAPVCISGTNSVTIYSKVNTTITIPVIKEI